MMRPEVAYGTTEFFAGVQVRGGAVPFERLSDVAFSLSGYFWFRIDLSCLTGATPARQL